MSSVSIVFPHQLFQNHPALDKSRLVFLLEEELFFKQYHFHKSKIAYHRATMKWYFEFLISQGYKVKYLDSIDEASKLENVFSSLFDAGVKEVYLSEVNDYLLKRRVNRYSKKYQIKINWCENPNYILSTSATQKYLKEKKKFFLTDFYIHFRKEFHVLFENNQPLGGKWTFDTENRKKMPEGTIVYGLPKITNNDIIEEAISYTQKHFQNNPGETPSILFPITFDDSKKWLDQFIEQRLNNFGVYQDAMVEGSSFLFHSVLTPMLNIGLINPDFIIDETIAAYHKKELPLNSVEGFIRQVFGWREFIKVVYEEKGVFQRKKNHFQHSRKIPSSFYNGTTGINPVDDVIRKTLNHGYAHHIERLMIIGNFMLLCEFDPDEVYRWFMELFIDAYDWVMVPNVYGMSQYADGGIMSTKPYISGSNYLLKMSNYKKGAWCEIWDSLYWLFIIKHKNSFAKNPRMSMMVSLANKLPEEKINHYQNTANNWFKLIEEKERAAL